jgi:hypothetical protein
MPFLLQCQLLRMNRAHHVQSQESTDHSLGCLTGTEQEQDRQEIDAPLRQSIIADLKHQ